MKSVSSKTFRSLLAVAIFFFSSMSHSSVISIDDSVFGVDSVTRDSISGLDWLDITFSINRSYADVSSQLGVGGDFEGWRYASGLEYAELWYGLRATFRLSLSRAYADRTVLGKYMPLLGYTNSWNTKTAGLTSDLVGSGYSIASIYNPSSSAYITARSTYGALDTQRDPSYGSWLVRDFNAISEPSIIVLMGLGIFGLGMVRCRKAQG